MQNVFAVSASGFERSDEVLLERLNAFLDGKRVEEVQTQLNKPLKGSTNVQLENGTALHYACYLGAHMTAEQLISAGAEVHATDRNGSTPLHRACQSHEPACVKMMIELGNANVNAVDKRKLTALHHAAGHGHRSGSEMARFLVEAGAKVMAQDGSGLSPLHHVFVPETAELLLQAGADINLEDHQGRTPLHLCLTGLTRPEAASVLIENGADLTAQAQLSVGGSREPRVSPVDCVAEALQRYFEFPWRLEEIIQPLTLVLPAFVDNSTAEIRAAHPSVLDVAVVGGQMLQRVANESSGGGVYIIDFIERLLEMGANINYAGKPIKVVKQDGNEVYAGGIGYTPLHYLLSPDREGGSDEESFEHHDDGEDGYMRDMLDEFREAAQSRGQKIDWKATSADGTTLLHLAVPRYPMTAERLVELVEQQDQDNQAERGSPSQGSSSFMETRMGPQQKTALHVAASGGEDIEGDEEEDVEGAVEILLRLGAVPQATTADGNSTALHLACQHGNSASAVACLLQHAGGGVGFWNAVDSSGRTALHYAVGRNDSSCLELVRPFMALNTQNNEKKDNSDEQFDVEILDEKDQTPLHILCCVGREVESLHSIVLWLLESTRDAETTQWLDHYGMTPLAWMAVQNQQNPHNVETLTSVFALVQQQAQFLSAGASRTRAFVAVDAQQKGNESSKSVEATADTGPGAKPLS